MENRFLNFLRKYCLCFLLSVIMVIGIFLSTVFADLYVIGDELIFDLSTLYILYVVPIYSLIYGCLSHIKVKKIWIPLLILYTVTCIYFFGTNLIIDKEFDAWSNILVFSMYPVIFSLFGAGITAFIYNVVKSTKKNKD